MGGLMRSWRISVNVQTQIIELRKQNLGIRRIAKSLNLARNTVRDFLRSIENENSIPIANKNDFINWNEIHQKNNQGVLIKTLWKEYCNPQELSYNAFYHRYRRHFGKPQNIVVRLMHLPGEKIYFDFTDGLYLTDRQTGEKRKTQLFIGVMPFSSLTKGEFILDQRQINMLPVMEKIFCQIGGVPKYAVFDNLKSAVQKAHIYDPDTNQTMIEFGNHWGFAVLPARPYTPRDKASVECGIGVIQRQFYQQYRNYIFYSLAEMNEKFQTFLVELNSSPMKDYDGATRDERFENERQNLGKLRDDRFEYSIWKTCKVHPDCHVQVEKKFYSVPFEYVGFDVRVRIKSKTIEIFSEEKSPIVVHAKLGASERVSTVEAHYPPEKTAVARFEIKLALKQAENVGPKTFELINSFFEGEYPLKLLRRAQGILRLVQSSQVEKKDLEYASEQAMRFNRKQFGYVKSAALFHKSGGQKLRSVAPIRDINHINLHQVPNPS